MKIALVGVLGFAVTLGACSFSAQAGGGANNEPPPPPPPPAAEPAAADPAPAPPAADPPPKATLDTKTGRIDIPGNIVFDTCSYAFTAGAGSETVLDSAVQYMKENPQVTMLRVEGHTDGQGDAALNKQLSGERALAVKDYLIEKGVAAERLIAVGFGMDKPIADNTTDEGRAQNRRIEFKIAQLKGRDYLGQPADGGGQVFESHGSLACNPTGG